MPTPYFVISVVKSTELMLYPNTHLAFPPLVEDFSFLILIESDYLSHHIRNQVAAKHRLATQAYHKILPHSPSANAEKPSSQHVDESMRTSRHGERRNHQIG